MHSCTFNWLCTVEQIIFYALIVLFCILFPGWTQKNTTKCRTSEQILHWRFRDKTEEEEGAENKGFITVIHFCDELFSLTSLKDPSCLLICCIASVLLGLRPSLRQPVMPVASRLSHMMWFDKGNLLQETTARLFAVRDKHGLWYALPTVLRYYYR